MKKFIILYISIVLSLAINGCKKEEQDLIKKQQFVEKSLNEQIQELLNQNAIVIDVRTPEEYKTAHFKNALNIPYDQIEQHLKELEKYKDKTIIVYCRSGRRSGIAKNILEMNGFKNVVNGINLTFFPNDQIVK